MKKYSEKYLRNIVDGDLNPKMEGRVKTMIQNIKEANVANIRVESDSYGSGFSSYFHVYVSKLDESDKNVRVDGAKRFEEIRGIMIYFCRLAPVAVLSSGKWGRTYQNNQDFGGYGHFICPEDVITIPPKNWSEELTDIFRICEEFGYAFFTIEEVDRELEFELSIPTILSDPPYKIFDCFFYWED